PSAQLRPLDGPGQPELSQPAHASLRSQYLLDSSRRSPVLEQDVHVRPLDLESPVQPRIRRKPARHRTEVANARYAGLRQLCVAYADSIAGLRVSLWRHIQRQPAERSDPG